MQSPFVSASHPQSPYNMAQMFMTSPPGNSSRESGYDYRQQRKHSVPNMAHGILTPGWWCDWIC